VYLFLHLGVLSLLAQGPEAWDQFLELAHSPIYLLLDVILIFGILFHGLNGIRVALVGMGIGVRQQRALFLGLMAVGLLLLVISAWLVFTV
jgi:succinate dehydrogenase / fumarate reductase cytochrome b subunit